MSLLRIGVVIVIVLTFMLGLNHKEVGDMATYKANAVVLIVNSIRDKNDKEESGLGTGFIIDDNLIVTNNHVIEDSKGLKVKGKNSEKFYEARVIATDKFSDIAIVELLDWKDFAETNAPSILQFGNSRDLRLGSKVWSIGHPWGLEWSVSQGVVSSPSRRIDGNLNFLIQTDTRIYQGNSGGPLLDENGDVIGINDKMLAQTGGSFGLAIPSNLAERVVEDLRKTGKAHWAVMGISMGYTEDGKNVSVKSIAPGSAAEKAGVQPNDIIFRIMTAHTPVLGTTVTSTDQLLDEMAVIHPGESVTLLVRRGNDVSTLQLIPDTKTSDELMPKEDTPNK